MNELFKVLELISNNVEKYKVNIIAIDRYKSYYDLTFIYKDFNINLVYNGKLLYTIRSNNNLIGTMLYLTIDNPYKLKELLSDIEEKCKVYMASLFVNILNENN